MDYSGTTLVLFQTECLVLPPIDNNADAGGIGVTVTDDMSNTITMQPMATHNDNKITSQNRIKLTKNDSFPNQNQHHQSLKQQQISITAILHKEPLICDFIVLHDDESMTSTSVSSLTKGYKLYSGLRLLPTCNSDGSGNSNMLQLQLQQRNDNDDDDDDDATGDTVVVQIIEANNCRYEVSKQTITEQLQQQQYQDYDSTIPKETIRQKQPLEDDDCHNEGSNGTTTSHIILPVRTVAQEVIEQEDGDDASTISMIEMMVIQVFDISLAREMLLEEYNTIRIFEQQQAHINESVQVNFNTAVTNNDNINTSRHNDTTYISDDLLIDNSKNDYSNISNIDSSRIKTEYSFHDYFFDTSVHSVCPSTTTPVPSSSDVLSSLQQEQEQRYEYAVRRPVANNIDKETLHDASSCRPSLSAMSQNSTTSTVLPEPLTSYTDRDLQWLESHLQKELHNTNVELCLLGVLGVVLAGFLGFTARQITWQQNTTAYQQQQQQRRYPCRRQLESHRYDELSASSLSQKLQSNRPNDHYDESSYGTESDVENSDSSSSSFTNKDNKSISIETESYSERDDDESSIGFTVPLPPVPPSLSDPNNLSRTDEICPTPGILLTQPNTEEEVCEAPISPPTTTMSPLVLEEVLANEKFSTLADMPLFKHTQYTSNSVDIPTVVLATTEDDQATKSQVDAQCKSNTDDAEVEKRLDPELSPMAKWWEKQSKRAMYKSSRSTQLLSPTKGSSNNVTSITSTTAIPLHNTTDISDRSPISAITGPVLPSSLPPPLTPKRGTGYQRSIPKTDVIPSLSPADIVVVVPPFLQELRSKVAQKHRISPPMSVIIDTTSVSHTVQPRRLDQSTGVANNSSLLTTSSVTSSSDIDEYW